MDYVDLLLFRHNAIAIFLWAFWIGLALWIATRRKWRGWVRGGLLAAIAAHFLFLVYLPYREAEQKKAERIAYVTAAREYFQKKCDEDSGRFIYKPVETPQEGVYMMKPRREPTVQETRDQFWMGDPYGVRGGYYEADTLVRGSSEKRFVPALSFVEAPDLDDPQKLWRYALKPTGRMHQGAGRRYYDPPIPEKKTERDPIDAIQSRYGYTWDDLSTQEDRRYWVAKGRLQIIDLQTKEVIAERIGYVIEEGFGGITNPNAKPWTDTGGGDNRWKRNYCPSRSNVTDAYWISSVLHTVPFPLSTE